MSEKSIDTCEALRVSSGEEAKKSKTIYSYTIKPGDIIVGLSSSGKSTYEKEYHSGFISNYEISLVNDVLHQDSRKCKVSPNITLISKIVSICPNHLNDRLKGTTLTIGEALLTPTRTYLPIFKKVFADPLINITGIIDCSEGGITKCINFGKGLKYYKYGLFHIPPIFKAIQTTEIIDFWRMFSIYNMGVGIEFTVSDHKSAMAIIDISKKFNVKAKIIGCVLENDTPDENQVIIVYAKHTHKYLKKI